MERAIINNIPREVLNSASQTLSILSKARCVKSYSFPKETRYKLLFPWPSYPLEDKESPDWLAEKGIAYDKKTKVKSYEVSHSDYKKKEKISIKELDQIELCRDIIVSLILSQIPTSNIVIEAFWDQEKKPKVDHPISTSDIERLRDFSRHSDSMLGFHHPSIDYKYKIPAYAGEVLFQEMGLFGNAKILPADRALSTGAKTDESGISKRFIVHQGNKGFLEKVMQSTIHSVSAIVAGQTWPESLKEKRENHITQPHCK
ncbi:hypothetical protein SAMN05421509_10315 [Chromohalobacter canadensis]|uniref:Uncharacterized protein n=1 Tax=Chromohalobacter canadensis TaxID=141389 RepID=A0A285VMW6_9GAMM|nr:hypothetical protein [Chromohalobacter canadensis]SOC53921.1 hypothetical protein SAMN05421509_10315 [Chromohalobacter canadensis]